MPNKNYLKGRRKEWKTCKELKEDGFIIAQRSAGSHSPIDVFAINKEKKLIKFIQCKPDNYVDDEIMKEWGWINEEANNFKVSFEVL